MAQTGPPTPMKPLPDKVKQPPPENNVRQPPPDSNVRQPPPDNIVRQASFDHFGQELKLVYFINAGKSLALRKYFIFTSTSNLFLKLFIPESVISIHSVRNVR